VTTQPSFRLPSKEWKHPLASRYTSEEMQKVFSDFKQFTTWRMLWYTILKHMKGMGLIKIPEGQLEKMYGLIPLINIDLAAEYERKNRHDVMAHVHAFQDICREHGLEELARFIHLALTSCDITDNAKLITMREALDLVLLRLARVMYKMTFLAEEHADLICAGFTHLQMAQPTTLGKRIAMWLEDLNHAYLDIRRVRNELPFRGIKDATGTQQSLMQLCRGDESLVLLLEQQVANDFDFNGKILSITGQTYSRQYDADFVLALAKLGSSASKMFFDVRILAMLDQIHEPFGVDQIGSSAQAFKQNPMRSERGNALDRMLIGLSNCALQTHASQGLERTLDDSAAGRITLSEAGLYADATCLVAHNVFDGLRVFPARIETHLNKFLPFLATVSIINEMVESHGADRQVIHDLLRVHSVASVESFRKSGAESYDMLGRMMDEPMLAPVHDKIQNFLDPKTMIGRAPNQARLFAAEVRENLKETYADRELSPPARDLKV